MVKKKSPSSKSSSGPPDPKTALVDILAPALERALEKVFGPLAADAREAFLVVKKTNETQLEIFATHKRNEAQLQELRVKRIKREEEALEKLRENPELIVEKLLQGPDAPKVMKLAGKVGRLFKRKRGEA